MQPLLIRHAEPRDLGRLVELLQHGSLVEGKEDPADLDAYRSALSEIRVTEGNDLLVAELDGQAVGMCQLVVFRHLQHHGGLCAEVESVHVHPDFRSQGIGGRLLEVAVEAARRAGCYRVQLTSNGRRTDAHRFYLHQGFEPTHLGFKRLIGSE